MPEFVDQIQCCAALASGCFPRSQQLCNDSLQVTDCKVRFECEFIQYLLGALDKTRATTGAERASYIPCVRCDQQQLAWFHAGFFGGHAVRFRRRLQPFYLFSRKNIVEQFAETGRFDCLFRRFLS